MSHKIIKEGGTWNMLHSLYDFKATYAKTLSFRNNEYFILQQSILKKKNWWEVINERGETGYIPSNYVENVAVNPSFYLHFIDNCLNNLTNVENKTIDLADEETIKTLEEIKSRLEELPDIKKTTITTQGNIPCLLFQNSNGQLEMNSASNCSSNIVSQALGQASTNMNSTIDVKEPQECISETLPENVSSERKKSLSSNIYNTSPAITHQLVYELVESVRINTQLSHEMSKIAVGTVVQGLHELLPASVFPYLSTIQSHIQTSLVVEDVHIDQTHDASRLRIIFNELTSCKEDSQQRSWMLHEDEGIIKEYLTELISILSNADASISRHVVSMDEYHCITTLIQYYQMEIRWSIRQLLLQAFGVLCSLDKTVIDIMLNSILPGELARDMVVNPRNIPKLNYSCLLLTMIFSMGFSMPVTHLELLGVQFLDFILNNIENPPDTDVDDQIPDIFINFLISFNLQFKDYDDNPVMNSLSNRSVARFLTEKLLLLLNREGDPVRIFDHTPAPPHSLLKFFVDLFTREDTANLFYTNDIKVLMDIVVRNIYDLSPDDERRRQCLELSRLIMKNTRYNEHKHRVEEIFKCFNRILCEDSRSSVSDQKLVNDILKEFPQYFQ